MNLCEREDARFDDAVVLGPSLLCLSPSISKVNLRGHAPNPSEGCLHEAIALTTAPLGLRGLLKLPNERL